MSSFASMYMTRLHNNEYDQLAGTGFSASFAEFALINAVVEQIQEGEVYVSADKSPLAFVKNKFGFSQLSYSKQHAFDASAFLSFLGDAEHRKGYYLMYDPPAALLELAPKAQLEYLKIRQREQFKYLHHDADQLLSIREQLAPSYRLVNLTGVQEKDITALQLDIGSRFWKSWQQFQQLGIGYGIVEPGEGRIVAVCYSACVAGGVAEIDVATHSDFRGKALASVAVAAFLEACINQQIIPNWDCFTSNIPSLKLARKFNFIPQKTYKLLSFNLN